MLSEGRELHPPLFGLAIVGPPVGRVGARAGLPPRAYALTGASPPAAAARVMGLWVRPIPRGGFAPPFPRSALGVRPEDPFRVAQRLTPSPLGLRVRSKGGLPPSAAFGAAPARISPGTQLTRQSGGVAAPHTHVRPRRHPGRFAPSLPHQAASPKGTSIRPFLLLPIACKKRLFSAPAP